MNLEAITYGCIFVFGVFLGSFLNVLIIRIPKSENFVVEPSHCVHCGYRLRWFDLIPLISYLCLGGKCRKCKKKISWQYPIVEFGNGCLWLGIFGINGISLESGLISLLASFLLVISVIDARIGEIPTGLCVTILALGIMETIFDRDNWVSHAIGFFAVSLFFYLILWISGGCAMGGGDVRLMAAAGCFLGWQNILLALILGCVIGSVIHLILMAACKLGRELKFGPYLSLGILISVLFGNEMIEMYLKMF